MTIQSTHHVTAACSVISLQQFSNNRKPCNRYIYIHDRLCGSGIDNVHTTIVHAVIIFNQDHCVGVHDDVGVVSLIVPNYKTVYSNQIRIELPSGPPVVRTQVAIVPFCCPCFGVVIIPGCC